MANIENITDAVNRVRTILDRGNSPWMSDNEIQDFISMATNEFVRERVNIFGATQEIRDDLGTYVSTEEFGWSDIDETSHWSNSGINIGEDAGINFGYLLGIKIEKLSATYDADGLLVQSQTAGSATETETDDVFVLVYESSYYECKVISLDDAQSTLDDPFNKPEEGSYRAVRVGDVYYIMPGLEQVIDNDNVLTSYHVHFDYVADNDADEETNIIRLPQHSREEVCLIAARKILGTTADERYPVGDSEINELNK